MRKRRPNSHRRRRQTYYAQNPNISELNLLDDLHKTDLQLEGNSSFVPTPINPTNVELEMRSATSPVIEKKCIQTDNNSPSESVSTSGFTPQETEAAATLVKNARLTSQAPEEETDFITEEPSKNEGHGETDSSIPIVHQRIMTSSINEEKE